MRQSGRPASHAYGAFHYIKPFQCIIYFCVSHLRYGLCTGDGGQRVPLALQHRRPKDSSPAQRASIARVPVYIILTYDFFTEVLLPSHLYCDKPFLHSGRPAVAPRPARFERVFSSEEGRLYLAEMRSENCSRGQLPVGNKKMSTFVISIFQRAVSIL